MKVCLYCEKEFKEKKDTAKYCKVGCRVMWNRKNKDKPKGLKPEQMMSILYHKMMDKIDAMNNIPILAETNFTKGLNFSVSNPKENVFVEEVPSRLSEYFSLIDNAESSAQVENIVSKSKQDNLEFFDKKKIQEFGTAKCIKLGY